MSIVTILQRERSDMLSPSPGSTDGRVKPSGVSTSGMKVAIWGAGAKGATYLNMVDPNSELIEFAVDITPEKQGKFIPGTGHEIKPPEALEDIDVVLLMNPNYREENQMLLDEAGIKTRIVDV